MGKPFRFCPKCATELVEEERGGRPRGVCPTCSFVNWDNPTPVVAAIVETPSGVVLVRSHGWPETWFGLVTGFLERDEDPASGCLREVEEELGLSGEIVELVGNYGFSRMHQVIMAYHVRAAGEIVLGDELEAHKVIPVEKLRPWPFGTGHAVKAWLAARNTAD